MSFPIHFSILILCLCQLFSSVFSASYTVQVAAQSLYDSMGAQWYNLAFFPNDLTIVFGDSVNFDWSVAEVHNVVFSGSDHLSQGQPNGVNLTNIAGEVGNQTHFVDPTALYSSGIKAINGITNTLIFIPNTGSGNFSYYCSIHEGMEGIIRVLPAGSTAPLTPAQVAVNANATIASLELAARQQSALLTSQAATSGPQVRNIRLSDGTINWIVTAGSMSMSSAGMQMFARFLPSYLEIHVNDTVTWIVDAMDPHWVFFNAAQTFPPLFANYNPNQTTALNASNSYVSSPYNIGITWFTSFGAPLTTIPTQTWPNSQGLVNSGLMFGPGGPPVFPSNISVKFTTIGQIRYSCPIHAELMGMFGTVNVKAANTALCTNASIPSTCALVAAAVRGDPQFAGFLGQSFQVHGIDGGIYNLITDNDIQINSKFTFIADGDVSECPNKPWKFSGLTQKIACWSHDGSYLSEIGMMDNLGNKLLIIAGSSQQGFSSLQFNGKEIREGIASVSKGKFSIIFHSRHHVSVTLDEFTLHIENSDQFVNLASVNVDRSRWSQLSSHGLLGQTWHRISPKLRGSLRDIEGEVDDYLINEENLFGTNFVFNKFNVGK